MLGTVDKIIGLVSDPNSLKTAIDTTDSVTSNPDQMPTDNQAQGANVMESMGNCMKTIKASPEEINNIAGSMLGTTGNVFLAASGTVPVISKNVFFATQKYLKKWIYLFGHRYLGKFTLT